MWIDTIVKRARYTNGPFCMPFRLTEWINRHVHFKYNKLETSGMDIRIYEKAAILRNIQRNKATYKDQDVELAVRVAQVWVNQQGSGNWLPYNLVLYRIDITRWYDCNK
jgi:hypothetical protein